MTAETTHDLRPAAFALAYRMLGSVSDAEDIVQEALLRLHQAMQKEPIAVPQAWLSTVVTRLCLDQLRSARARRETYFGEWLPEPLVAEVTPAAEQRYERAQSLSMAFLLLLETLSPVQRAVFLLRDVFDYEYADIARMVGKSEAACRQIAVRARAHVREGRPRFEVRPQQHERLVERFFAAIEEGDVAGLENVLAEHVTLQGDGGGRVPALARALHGRATVAKTLLNWARAGARAGGYTIRRATVNGQPGALIVTAAGAVVAVWALDVVTDRIAAVRSIVNPDKLRHIPGAGDFGRWLHAARVHGRASG
jgi:RNA polymerase sigma-70 factor (TIGR02957 family)